MVESESWYKEAGLEQELQREFEDLKRQKFPTEPTLALYHKFERANVPAPPRVAFEKHRADVLATGHAAEGDMVFRQVAREAKLPNAFWRTYLEAGTLPDIPWNEVLRIPKAPIYGTRRDFSIAAEDSGLDPEEFEEDALDQAYTMDDVDWESADMTEKRVWQTPKSLMAWLKAAYSLGFMSGMTGYWDEGIDGRPVVDARFTLVSYDIEYDGDMHISRFTARTFTPDFNQAQWAQFRKWA